MRVLTQFEVANFQAFGERQTAELAPMTLVFGPNSAGKSSLIRALMAVVQSFPAVDRSYPLVLNGPLVDLGPFKAAVHRHDSGKSPQFGLMFTSPTFLSVTLQKRDLSVENTFGVSLQYSLNNDVARLREVEFRGIPHFPDLPADASVNHFLATQSDAKTSWNGRLCAQDILELATPGSPLLEKILSGAALDSLREEAILEPSDDWTDYAGQTDLLHGALDTVPWKLSVLSDNRAPAWLFYPIAAALATFCKSIRFIGPLRATPQRLSRTSESQRGMLGPSADALPSQLAGNATLITVLNRLLPLYGFHYTVEVRSVGDEFGGGVRIVLRDLRRDGTEVLLTDVGVGVSQALPMMVEAILACADPTPLRRMLVVEQPEIHLHPRLQAQFADFISLTAGVDSGQPVEGGQPIQWLVETHSEAMVLRIQRRVREGRIAPESVSILYVSPDASGSTIKRLRLDGDGNFIDDWPDGFFAERLDEVFGRPSGGLG